MIEWILFAVAAVDPTIDTTIPEDVRAKAQEVAEAKAEYMARHRTGGHHLMHLNSQIPGYCFEGTGWGGQSHKGTCYPGFPCRLAGHARWRNGGTYYRVRIWVRGNGKSYQPSTRYYRRGRRRR